MDFFSRQDAARRATVRLVVYFIVAVALIFQGVNSLLYLLAMSASYDNGSGSLLWHAWSAQALTGTLILVGGVVCWNGFVCVKEERPLPR